MMTFELISINYLNGSQSFFMEQTLLNITTLTVKQLLPYPYDLAIVFSLLCRP